MLVVLGAGLAAIVLAVARNRMRAQLARTFRAIADTVTVDHEPDSFGSGRRGEKNNPCYQCRLVGRYRPNAARNRLAFTVGRVHLWVIGRLSGRHRSDAASRLASSYRGLSASAGDGSAGRPPSLAGQLPQ